MTSEQIAELRKLEHRADRPCGTFDGKTYRLSLTPEQSHEMDMALAALPRLLDEREALLEALRGLLKWPGYTDSRLEAELAIRKAESP